MDATDTEAFAVRYCGCLIVELYNWRGPNTALGDRTPNEAYCTERTLPNCSLYEIQVIR